MHPYGCKMRTLGSDGLSEFNQVGVTMGSSMQLWNVLVCGVYWQKHAFCSSVKCHNAVEAIAEFDIACLYMAVLYI